MTWRLVNADVPSSRKAAEYLLLVDKGVFQKTCSDRRLNFPPTIRKTLHSASPPSLDFFRSLNVDASYAKNWGIYIILMEKTGEAPKLYVGSGTSGQYGVRTRLAVYKNLVTGTVARLIRSAASKGYVITSIGLLCWAAIPHYTLQPLARLRFLAIEALFCILFFAGPVSSDSIWPQILL